MSHGTNDRPSKPHLVVFLAELVAGAGVDNGLNAKADEAKAAGHQNDLIKETTRHNLRTIFLINLLGIRIRCLNIFEYYPF